MKKKHPEHVNLERWLVSYADFMTLLFAFFVIMYALSQSDKAKFIIAIDSIRKAFGAGPVGMVDLGGASGGQTANPFEMEEAPGGRILNLPAGKTNTAAEKDSEIHQIKELLEESISWDLGSSDDTEKPTFRFDRRGLVIRLAVRDFFPEGRVEPRKDILPILDRIAGVLSKTERNIIIEGHTDLDEYKATQKFLLTFANDFSLSFERARRVADRWIHVFKIPDRLLEITGRGSSLPLTFRKGELEKAKNRRIEIILLKTRYDPADNLSEQNDKGKIQDTTE